MRDFTSAERARYFDPPSEDSLRDYWDEDWDDEPSEEELREIEEHEAELIAALDELALDRPYQ